MRKILLFVVVIFFTTASISQDCTDCRYVSQIFDSITISTVQFGSGVTASGDTQQLFMDVYEPFGDTIAERPVVIFAFGGGFVQGSKDDWYVVEVCRHFTKAGYVSVAIDYRTGVELTEVLSQQFMRIFFRPMQDMRASIQYLKWDYAENGNTWSIDTNMIFAGGASAGAITALMMQYCDKSTEIAYMGDTAALDALGGFWSTTGFHQNYNWDVAATVNVAGALINAQWIEPGDDPIISAHGDADQVVPYSEGALAGLSFLGFNLQGSYIVDTVARNRGVCSYLFTMEGRDHPSESMGIEYFYSIVYRMMLKMQAIRLGKSFCCPLSVDVTPGDTLFYGENTPPAILSATVLNDNGNSQLHWCTMPCQLSSDDATITVQPDSNLKYVAASIEEAGCLSGDLYIVYDSANLLSGSIELKSDVSLRVFPQPASSLIYVRLDNSYNENTMESVELYNLKGQQVYRYLISGNEQSNEFDLDVTNLPRGTYLLRVKLEDNSIGIRKVTLY